MSTMCAIVCPNFGALPETTANYSFSYSYEPDPERHKVIFSHVLKDVIDNWSSNNVCNYYNMVKFIVILFIDGM